MSSACGSRTSRRASTRSTTRSTGTCEVASAGHLPPLLVRPDGTNELLDVSPAPPLGIGARPIRSRTLQIDDGSLLVLYTDGLVEKRTEDIDEGLAGLRERLRPWLAPTSRSTICARPPWPASTPTTSATTSRILIARLRRLPAGPARHLEPARRS